MKQRVNNRDWLIAEENRERMKKTKKHKRKYYIYSTNLKYKWIKNTEQSF